MPEKTSPRQKAEKAMMASIGKLRNTGTYSDLTIKCKGKVFKVHRAIICTQSRPLAAMVDGNWKEAETGIVELEDDDPSIIAKMIDFLYRTRYHDDRGIDEDELRDVTAQLSIVPSSDAWQSSVETEAQPDHGHITASLPVDTTKGPLITNATVYILADKYDVQSLKKVAAHKYAEMVKDRWSNETFVESARLVYDNIIANNDILKEVIIEAMHSNLSMLMDRGDFLGLLRGNGDIATDILHASTKPLTCSHCSGFNFATCNNCNSRL